MNKMITYDILCIAMDLVLCIYICICICLYLYAVFCAATDFSVNKDLYKGGNVTSGGWHVTLCMACEFP